jgi:hypothetical protein
MKLKYIFLVLFGIIIFLILNNINTFIIGNPYIYNPPVDTPLHPELEIYRGRVWNTIEEMQEEFATDDVYFGLIEDPTNDINFIPESNTSPLTISTNNGDINFNVVNTIGHVNTRVGSEIGCEKRVVISKGSSDGLTLKDTDTNISDTEFAIKLKKYLDTEHVEGHRCVFRIDVDIYAGGGCEGARYLYLPYDINIENEGDIFEMFTMDRIQSAKKNVNQIIIPFLYLMFCQLNIENLNIPDRFQTFFVGQEMVAFEVSSVGNATKMNMFHMNNYLLAIDGLGEDILNPLDVDIFPDLSPLTDDEIHTIETTHFQQHTSADGRAVELKKKYIKHIRNLINNENILLSIKTRIYIFLDEDPQFIINGDNIGVLDFDMTKIYQRLIDITYEHYNNLTHPEMNVFLVEIYGLQILQIFGDFTQEELLNITYNIYNIYTSMIQLGFMNLEHINKLFQNILYSIKYAYQRFLNLTWIIGTTEDFLSVQFITLENLLFNRDVIFPTAEEGVPVVEISDNDDDDDLCEPEPEPETECISTCSSCESHSD